MFTNKYLKIMLPGNGLPTNTPQKQPSSFLGICSKYLACIEWAFSKHGGSVFGPILRMRCVFKF